MPRPCQGNDTLQRGAVEGCEYSVVDANGADYFVGVATPTVPGDVATQLKSAFENLKTALRPAWKIGDVVKLDVFLRHIGARELARLVVREECGASLLATTTCVAQSPCDEIRDVAILAVAVKRSGDAVGDEPFSILSNARGTVVGYDGVAVGFFGDIVPSQEPVGAYDRSLNAFERLRSDVEGVRAVLPQSQSGNFNLSDVFRTWIYQGHIVAGEGETQRYKELNRARSDFFRGTRFLQDHLPKDRGDAAVYPASTGIGADDGDVAMSCVAIRSNREDVVVAPLENPNQISAFDYSETYSPKSPKFARAMLTSFDDRAAVFVSGTASIVNEETVFVGDVVGQTNQTLDNIEALISGANIAKHGVCGFDAKLEDLVVARVYVKRAEDYAAVRAICDRRLPGVPTVYTRADVCRDDLLVEIEGVVACRRAK